MKKIGNLLLFVLISHCSLSQRIISADLYKELGERSDMYNICVGAGRANEGLRATWRAQLELVKKTIDFKYIRFHGLLHDDMGVYSEKNGVAVYNWQYVDDLYDYLMSIHVRPFVELSFMPGALASGNKTVFWWKGNITPPKDLNKWNALIKALVLHWQERYGKQEVEKWYFEVWNEPDYYGFWSGSQDEYFKLYEATARTIKSISESYRVGGPGSSGVKWIDETLAYCKLHQVPLNFISTHSYNVDGVPIDEFGNKELQLKTNPDAVIDDVKSTYNKIKNSTFKGIELHFTEWSSSYSASDPIHDTYQNASFVLHTLKHTERYANSMSYWVFTDVFEEGGVPKTPFHGGFGLINLQNINKPTYYAYKFLNELSKVELANSDGESYVTKNKNNKEITVLFWSFDYPKMGSEIDNTYFKKLWPSKENGKVTVALENMISGLYRIEIYKIGYRNNDAFSEYHDMGQPYNLNRVQELYLKQKSNGAPVEIKNVLVKNSSLKKAFTVKENDVIFIKLLKL